MLKRLGTFFIVVAVFLLGFAASEYVAYGAMLDDSSTLALSTLRGFGAALVQHASVAA